jgi:nuclear polyadenylated RNA-binding protein 3
MDNASLQALLGSMTTSQQQNGPAAASNANIDLASLLNGLKPQQSQQVQYQAPTPTNAYSGVDYAALLGNQPQQAAPQQSAQQVQNIMAQLARFRQ